MWEECCVVRVTAGHTCCGGQSCARRSSAHSRPGDPANPTPSFQTPVEGGETQTHQGLELWVLFPQFVDWPRRDVLAAIHGGENGVRERKNILIGRGQIKLWGRHQSPRVSEEMLLGSPSRMNTGAAPRRNALPATCPAFVSPRLLTTFPGSWNRPC